MRRLLIPFATVAAVFFPANLSATELKLPFSSISEQEPNVFDPMHVGPPPVLKYRDHCNVKSALSIIQHLKRTKRRDVIAKIECLLSKQEGGRITDTEERDLRRTIDQFVTTNRQILLDSNKDSTYFIDYGFSKPHLSPQETVYQAIYAMIVLEDWTIFQKHEGNDSTSRYLKAFAERLEALAPDTMNVGRRAMHNYYNSKNHISCASLSSPICKLNRI